MDRWTERDTAVRFDARSKESGFKVKTWEHNISKPQQTVTCNDQSLFVPFSVSDRKIPQERISKLQKL